MVCFSILSKFAICVHQYKSKGNSAIENKNFNFMDRISILLYLLK